MKAWGFEYKTNIVWLKIRKDGGPDGRGVGFYYRNVTELVLFGTRGHLRTAQAGRRMVNFAQRPSLNSLPETTAEAGYSGVMKFRQEMRTAARRRCRPAR